MEENTFLAYFAKSIYDYDSNLELDQLSQSTPPFNSFQKGSSSTDIVLEKNSLQNELEETNLKQINLNGKQDLLHHESQEINVEPSQNTMFQKNYSKYKKQPISKSEDETAERETLNGKIFQQPLKFQEGKTIKKCKQNKNVKIQRPVNITRNYINGMIQYIFNNKEEVLKWLQLNNLQLSNQEKFFNKQLKQRINKMYSIKHFKRLLSLKTCQGTIIRVFGYKFLKEESFQWFYSQNFKQKELLIQYRRLLDQAFRNSDNFTQFQQ